MHLRSLIPFKHGDSCFYGTSCPNFSTFTTEQFFFRSVSMSITADDFRVSSEPICPRTFSGMPAVWTTEMMTVLYFCANPCSHSMSRTASSSSLADACKPVDDNAVDAVMPFIGSLDKLFDELLPFDTGYTAEVDNLHAVRLIGKTCPVQDALRVFIRLVFRLLGVKQQ